MSHKLLSPCVALMASIQQNEAINPRNAMKIMEMRILIDTILDISTSCSLLPLVVQLYSHGCPEAKCIG